MLSIQTVLQPSQIHGIGLFAAEFIPKGRLVAKYTPGLDITVQLEELDPELSPYSEIMRTFLRKYSYWDDYKKLYIVSVDNSRFINHSRTPNLHSPNHPDEFDCLYAIRDIEPGEELTEDYSTWNDPYWNDQVRMLEGASSQPTPVLAP